MPVQKTILSSATPQTTSKDGVNDGGTVGQWYEGDMGEGYDIVLMADKEAQSPCL